MAGSVVVVPQRPNQSAVKAALIGNTLQSAAETLFLAERAMRERKKDELSTLTAAANALGGFQNLPGSARIKAADAMGLSGLPKDAEGAPIFPVSLDQQVKELELNSIKADQQAAALGDQNAITRMGQRQGFVDKSPSPADIRLREEATQARSDLAQARKYEAEIAASSRLDAADIAARSREKVSLTAADARKYSTDVAAVSREQAAIAGGISRESAASTAAAGRVSAANIYAEGRRQSTQESIKADKEKSAMLPENAPSGFVSITGKAKILKEDAAIELGYSNKDYVPLLSGQYTHILKGASNVAREEVRSSSRRLFKAEVITHLNDVPQLKEMITAFGDPETKTPWADLGPAKRAVVTQFGMNMGKTLWEIDPNGLIDEEFSTSFFGAGWDNKDNEAFMNGFTRGQAEGRKLSEKQERDAARAPIGFDIAAGKPIYKDQSDAPIPAAEDVTAGLDEQIVELLTTAADRGIAPQTAINDLVRQTGLPPAKIQALYMKAQQKAASEVR